MIILLTDFGSRDPYVGQVKAVFAQYAPQQAVVDLLHEVPDFNPHAGAHLLAAWAPQFPLGSVFFAVIDAGVGGDRDAVIVLADGRWLVGPDNGLLSVVAGRAESCRVWRITWRPTHLSNSFHGRDLFAPIAAWIATGEFPHDKVEEITALHTQFAIEDLSRIIYIDHYGNAYSGVRAASVPQTASLQINQHSLKYARVYSDVARGAAFWFGNSIGLVEIAVNRGSAADALGLQIGQTISFSE